MGAVEAPARLADPFLRADSIGADLGVPDPELGIRLRGKHP
jgi:hypothetical protein